MEPLGAPHPLRPRRTRAPRAARTAVAVFRALEAAPIGLVVFDRALRFVHVNPWMARLNQLAPGAHLGRTMRELFPGFAREVARTEARIRAVLETGRPAVFSGSYADPAEQRHDWMATYFPVRLASGEIHCACGVIADVTADREREATLARARRDAERTSRRLGYLQDVTAALAAAEDPAAVAEVVVDRVRPLVGAAAATMRVVRGDALELLAASGDLQVPAALRAVPLRAGYPVAAAVSRAEPIWLEDRAALEARFPEALEASGSAQAMGVAPLTAHGRSIGSIAFVFDRPQAFDLEDRAFLLAAAEQSAQALDRALAHEAERTSRHLAQRATHRLARLQALTASLAGASTVGEVATVLVHGSRTALGAQTAVTYVLEPGTSTLVLAAALGAADSHRRQLGTLPLDAPAPAAHAARTGEALWLSTPAELRAAFPGFGAIAPYAGEIGALAALPLRARGEVLGALGFAFGAARTFEADDRDLLSSVADQCAQALDRARLLDAERDARAGERRAAERLERLQEITAALSAARTPAEVAATMIERVHPLVRAAAFLVHAVAPDGAHLRLLGCRGVSVDPASLERLPLDGPLPPCRAAATGASIWIETREEAHAAVASAWNDRRRGALAALPLRAGGRVLGSFSFSFDAPHRFDEAERRFLESVAEQCGVALDRSRLLEEAYQAREEAERARQSAERSREEAERARSLFDGILENAPLGIGFLDRELRFQQVNRRLAELNGLPVEAHLGKTPRELLPGLPIDDVERAWRRVAETGEPVEDVEIQGETPAAPGRRVWLASWYPVRAGGATIGYGVLVREVTREREAQAFERHVVGVVGHDLRNPLSAIVTATKLLLRPGAPSDPARLLGRISASAARIEEIIRTLLDFANVRGGGGVPLRRGPHDLAEIAREVAEECTLAHPGRQVLCAGEGDCTGNWDPGRIGQLLTNLVSNALQHGPEDQPVHVRWRGLAREVVLEVANAGRPIPPEIVPRLFEPFQRGDDARRGGLGLGLFIARAIVAAHGGRIEVRSGEPEGTVFSVRLPRE